MALIVQKFGGTSVGDAERIRAVAVTGAARMQSSDLAERGRERLPRRTYHLPMPPSAPGKGEPWYRDGLRFECTMCGNCCTGPEGVVMFSPEEGQAMADKLGLPLEEFLARYSRRVGRQRSLREKRTDFGNDCIFLDRNSIPGKAVCGVYEDRPAQCRTWPFWDSNLRSPQAWAEAAEASRRPDRAAARDRIIGRRYRVRRPGWNRPRATR